MSVKKLKLQKLQNDRFSIYDFSATLFYFFKLCNATINFLSIKPCSMIFNVKYFLLNYWFNPFNLSFYLAINCTYSGYYFGHFSFDVFLKMLLPLDYLHFGKNVFDFSITVFSAGLTAGAFWIRLTPAQQNLWCHFTATFYIFNLQNLQIMGHIER